jgi:hypothetical protein
VPDICGALDSENGRGSGTKYQNWLRTAVPEHADQAPLIYGLRCSLLHQGSAMPQGSHFPLAFMHPSAGQVHNLSTLVGGEQVGWLSIPHFVDEVTRGAERWLEEFGSTHRVQRNLAKFVRFRPEGLPPHLAGPVIA